MVWMACLNTAVLALLVQGKHACFGGYRDMNWGNAV
jgi:hypothetical protein